MMEDKRKIKEIYNCDYIVSDEELYPLQRWHNKLIDKTVNDITMADILRMMRQKVFLNLAMEKAMDFLQDSVFAGEIYEGELLEKIAEMDTSFLNPYADKLKVILKDASDISEMHEWSYDGEREEFSKIINSITLKI